MTRLSAPTLYQCDACFGYFTRSVLTSLHFHDDVPSWSDGMSGQWWAGIGAPVGRCPSCTRVVWVDDARVVMLAPRQPHPIGTLARVWHRLTGDRQGRLRDEQNWITAQTKIKDAPLIVGLKSMCDFLHALADISPDDRDREVYVRLRLWWASNDHRRFRATETPIEPQPAVAPEACTNILRLLDLFENDPSRQVERGELLRQLGRFEEAVAVLKAVKPNGYSEVRASKIQRLAQSRNAQLMAL